MKNNNQNSGKNAAAITRVQVIKLGVDVHADSYVVVRIVEGQAPQPGQRMAPAAFEAFVKKQLAQAEKVYACYEAGPFGYSLQRRLTELGAVCYVVRPRDWDEYGSRVKTDKRDAHELALCLDRYVGGNTKAFAVVRVPTPQEEQQRSQSRLRQSLLKHQQRLAAQGRGDALYYGYRVRGSWWKGAAWRGLEQKLPAHLLERLRSLQGLIEVTEKELGRRTRQLQNSAPADLPEGIGRLTAQFLEREVCDWSRFKNRRQVASYTGLCPREESSGRRRFQGHINKHGNRRLRPLLIECLWRLVRAQPDYRLVKKWGPLLSESKVTRSRRKQIIVAMARQFAVDWWRVRTGRLTAQSLGLV
jgi:transposase